MRTWVCCFWMLAVGVSTLCMVSVIYAGSDEGLRHGDVDGNSSPVNPLIAEMRMLDVAFREVVSGVSLGDSQRVIKALEGLHGSKEKTHEGIHTGDVHIPRNADHLEEFVRMDEEFHRRLEDLAEAAQRGSQGQMLELTNELLGRCVGCHREFRK